MSQRIHLDATPGLFHQVLHCHQGDVGRQFEIAVVTRDGYEIPSGATFKIQATKPSGLGFTVTGTAANNIISFTSTEDMTSEAGEIPTQLEIKSGNDVIYTSNFLLVCETNVHPSSVTDGSPEEIISEITLLVERAESAASTAGADAAAAAQARVDEMMNYLPTEVTNLKSDINALGFEEIQTVGDLITAQGLTLTSTQGAMWSTNGTIVTSSAYSARQAVNEPIAVEAGETYKFYGIYDAYNNGALMLFDSNMQNGLRVWDVVSADGGEYTIPSGYSYMCLDLYSGINLSSVSIVGNVGTGKYMSEKIIMPNDSINAEMTDYTEAVTDPSWISTTNLLQGNQWSNSGYMRLNNGQLTTSEYTGGYIASDFIPVVSGFKYRAKMPADQGCTLYAVFFSDTQNDGSSVEIGWIGDGDYAEFEVPSGKTQVSFNCVYNGTNKLSALYRRTQLDNEKGISIPRLVLDGGQKPFTGKTIVNFGDSIFGQARPPVDVSTFLAENTGATVYNAGFGGCQMSKHAQTAYDPFSMYRLADAIADNDWTLQDNAISSESSLPSYYAETVAMLKGLDFSEIDYITIGYGINDFHNGASLEAESTNGYKYCMDYSINKLLTAFPNLEVFIVTMTYGFDSNGDTNSFTHTSWVDSTTHSYLDFIQGQYDVAKNYQLPVIDLYYDLGINSINKLHYFSASDGTHQALNGRKLIAEKMAHDLW